MNRFTQMVPGVLGISSEAAALAAICTEYLLDGAAGVSDYAGEHAARALGECVAFSAAALAGAVLLEEASPESFRQ